LQQVASNSSSPRATGSYLAVERTFKPLESYLVAVDAIIVLPATTIQASFLDENDCTLPNVAVVFL
jgi:hypothetical protein